MGDTSAGMVVDQVPTDWFETAAVDNGVATATRAAAAGKHHYITGVIAGYTAAAVAKKLTIKAGATTIAVRTFSDGIEILFPRPVRVEANTAVSAELDASGGAGNTGRVTLLGYTR
jgi:hypothetical protein